MARRRMALVGWLIMVAIPVSARGQVPGLPGGSASSLFAPSASTGLASSAATGAATAAPAVAAPKTIFSFFGLSKSNLAMCKQKFCASPYGSLSNNALGPYSKLTGGLIPMCCPTVPTDASIAALAAQGGPNGAEAVAAKVMKDEADAKARRAAIRYLSTVDCHYWPEAELAIISGLRDDRNECVRYEAALALLNGCCCNARTIEALNIVVAGSEKDGKPAETSERVQCAALAALQGCLLRFHPPEPKVPPEKPDSPEPPDASRAVGTLDPTFRRVAYYYQALATRADWQVVADARKTVGREAARPAHQEPAMPGERSLYHAVARARKPKPTAPALPPETPTTDDLRPIEPAVVVSSSKDSSVVKASASAQGGRRGGSLIAIIRNAADPDSAH